MAHVVIVLTPLKPVRLEDSEHHYIGIQIYKKHRGPSSLDEKIHTFTVIYKSCTS